MKPLKKRKSDLLKKMVTRELKERMNLQRQEKKD
jgi:hypothetical protein